MPQPETHASFTKAMSDFWEKRKAISQEEKDASDRFDDEWALSDQVLTTIMEMVPGRYKKYAFDLPTGYFWAHFKDKPKEQWPEIFASTKHLAANYSSAVNPKYGPGTIEIELADDVLPLKMDPR